MSGDVFLTEIRNVSNSFNYSVYSKISKNNDVLFWIGVL